MALRKTCSIHWETKYKGKIQKGYDADLVVWDANKKFLVTENIIQHKHKITPYLTETLYGVVVANLSCWRKNI